MRGTLFCTTTQAQRLNDSASTREWRDVAVSMDATIKSFTQSGTIQDTQRKWDRSVIAGTLYGGTPEIFPPSDEDVMFTMSQIKTNWDETCALNAEDDAANITGTLIRRYADDHYPGCGSQGGGKSHAWILCSNALYLYYRSTLFLQQHLEEAKAAVSPEHIDLYADLFAKDQPAAGRQGRLQHRVLGDCEHDGGDAG